MLQTYPMTKYVYTLYVLKDDMLPSNTCIGSIVHVLYNWHHTYNHKHVWLMPGSCWAHAGLMLGSCWAHVGLMLGSCPGSCSLAVTLGTTRQ
jgi:hypothetical protein